MPELTRFATSKRLTLNSRLSTARQVSRGDRFVLLLSTAGVTHLEEHASDEAVTSRIEPVLARLYPIERAIMQTSACTIAGLGVKARHAAYVMSQYWEEPVDQIDWEAQAARLLIEAVCDVARTPLPFRNLSDSE